jgi:hypothetical protein
MEICRDADGVLCDTHFIPSGWESNIVLLLFKSSLFKSPHLFKVCAITCIIVRWNFGSPFKLYVAARQQIRSWVSSSRNYRLSQRCRWEVHSGGILRSVTGCLLPKLLGMCSCLIFKGPKCSEDLRIIYWTVNKQTRWHNARRWVKQKFQNFLADNRLSRRKIRHSFVISCFYSTPMICCASSCMEQGSVYFAPFRFLLIQSAGFKKT